MRCGFGDLCTKAHNKVEAFYKPDKYKTKFCTYYPYNCNNCDYGEYCCFAHSEDDIMIELLHNMEYNEDFYIFYYKTVKKKLSINCINRFGVHLIMFNTIEDYAYMLIITRIIEGSHLLIGTNHSLVRIGTRINSWRSMMMPA